MIGRIITGDLEARNGTLFELGPGVYVANMQYSHHGTMIDGYGNAKLLADAWNNRRHCSGAKSILLAGDVLHRNVRPCPWCGSWDIELQGQGCDTETADYWLSCCECHGMGPSGRGVDAAVAMWNVRRA